MSDKKIAVVLDGTLSTETDKRYVIIDTLTGEVLDNAQGYGYKSERKAYASYAYKTKAKSKDKEKAKNNSQIRKWLEEHKDFTEALDTYAFEAAKTSPSGQSKVDLALIKALLKASGLKTDFTPSKILRCWLDKNSRK